MKWNLRNLEAENYRVYLSPNQNVCFTLFGIYVYFHPGLLRLVVQRIKILAICLVTSAPQK